MNGRRLLAGTGGSVASLPSRHEQILLLLVCRGRGEGECIQGPVGKEGGRKGHVEYEEIVLGREGRREGGGGGGST